MAHESEIPDPRPMCSSELAIWALDFRGRSVLRQGEFGREKRSNDLSERTHPVATHPGEYQIGEV